MTTGYRRHKVRLSAPAYFTGVAVVTIAIVALLSFLRPAFGYSVKQWLGFEDLRRATASSFYTVRVAPIFNERCVGCHGTKRQKSELRMDSYANVLRGGKNGAVVVPSRPDESELIVRLVLPPSDPKVMPPEGKAPLTSDEIDVIKMWVAAGASGDMPVTVFRHAPPPARRIAFPEFDEAAVAAAREARAPLVKQLQLLYPGAINYESRDSVNLHVNASVFGAEFDDADVVSLAPIADRITLADFSGTRVSDASAETIALMTRLRALRLLNTRIGPATVGAVQRLPKIQSVAITPTAGMEPHLTELQQRRVRIYDGVPD